MFFKMCSPFYVPCGISVKSLVNPSVVCFGLSLYLFRKVHGNMLYETKKMCTIVCLAKLDQCFVCFHHVMSLVIGCAASHCLCCSNVFIVSLYVLVPHYLVLRHILCDDKSSGIHSHWSYIFSVWFSVKSVNLRSIFAND